MKVEIAIIRHYDWALVFLADDNGWPIGLFCCVNRLFDTTYFSKQQENQIRQHLLEN